MFHSLASPHKSGLEGLELRDEDDRDERVGGNASAEPHRHPSANVQPSSKKRKLVHGLDKSPS